MASEDRRKAEKSARLYLEMRGYKILEQNWGLSRNKIDVIAEKSGIVSFIEIHAASNSYVTEPLTESKLKKLNSAADAWVTENKFEGEYYISSLYISAPSYAVIAFNENI